MSEKISSCPSCKQSLYTPAEMAAHNCPTDDTQDAATIAKMKSIVATAERAAIQPTPEALTSGCASAVQQLWDFWDGEVEAIVIMVPKGSNQFAYATTITDREKTLILLRRLLQRQADQQSLRKPS